MIKSGIVRYKNRITGLFEMVDREWKEKVFIFKKSFKNFKIKR